MTKQEIAEKLPELASRVDALKSKHYMGCGFHYSKVNTLNYLLETANRETELKKAGLLKP